MARRTGVIAAVAAVGLAGCLDGQLSRSGFRNKPVDVPAASEATVASAARVDQVGRLLVSQNPFLGLEPMFHTIGSTEPEVYHPDATGVFVTQGLVDRCRTDAELAAVLAGELGKIAAEKRAADRMRLPDPLPSLPDAGGAALGSDPSQLAVQAVFDGKSPRTTKGSKPRTENPRQIAEEILRSAGYESKALDDVAPLLEQSRRNHAVADQMAGHASKPQWSP